jgi:uncharacterized protein YjiS (DUF1127 family)
MTKHAVTALPHAGRPAGAVVMQALARGFDHVLVWQDRLRQRHRLAAYDDRMLSDIGLSRADVHRETEKPFWLP